MTVDPFERAKRIRQGELDDEMPTLDELKGWIRRCPDSWHRSILEQVITCMAASGLYKDGGISKYVATIERVACEPSSFLRRDLSAGQSNSAS